VGRTKNCAVAINLDNLQGTIDAMKGEDFFETFYEQGKVKSTKEKKDDNSTDKEKLMMDTEAGRLQLKPKLADGRRQPVTVGHPAVALEYCLEIR
jgi:hypothetical protein